MTIFPAEVARRFALLGALSLAAGCGPQLASDTTGAGDEGDSQEITRSAESAIVGQNATVTATSLNLRSGPSTTDAVLLVMPQGATVPVEATSNGWYKVTYTGQTGWCSGAFLTPVGGSSGGGSSSGGSSAGGSSQVAEALARAASGMGFSYHWGTGCWDPSSTAHGSCLGSCPNCSHSGSWGADCSGFVAKVWQVPGASALTTCQHPYSTWNFYNQHDHWSDVSRTAAKPGDAFVHNSGSSGHIVIFDGGDAWGWSKAYECKGCSYGCVHDTRTLSSDYKGIRREGF